MSGGYEGWWYIGWAVFCLLAGTRIWSPNPVHWNCHSYARLFVCGRALIVCLVKVWGWWYIVIRTKWSCLVLDCACSTLGLSEEVTTISSHSKLYKESACTYMMRTLQMGSYLARTAIVLHPWSGYLICNNTGFRLPNAIRIYIRRHVPLCV